MWGYPVLLFLLPFPPSSNDIKWHAMILILIAIPADAMICKDMFCIHIHCHSCWCIPFEWIRIEWIRIGGMRIEWIRIETIRIGGIRIEWIRIETIRIDRIRVEWIRIEKICVEWCVLICMVWHTPAIFWRTLRRNVFREKISFCLHVDQGGGTAYYSKGFANHNAEHGPCFTTNFLSYLLTRCTIKRVRDVFAHNLHRLCGRRVLFYYVFSGVQHWDGRTPRMPLANTSFSPLRFTLNWRNVIGNGKYHR